MGRTIALVSSSFFPDIGGVAEHTLHVAQDLVRRGHTVEVWSLDRGDRRPPANHGGVRVRYLPAPSRDRGLVSIFTTLMATPGARAAWHDAWRALGPDVVHVHGFAHNGTFASRMALSTNTPLIISSHGETFRTVDGAFESSRALRRAFRAGLRGAAAVTACSSYAAADLERFGLDPDDVRVVYDGIDPDEKASVRPEWAPKRYILAVGKMFAVNGFDLLLQAFAHASLPADIKLVLAGDGPQRGELEQLTEALGIGSQVVFPGALDRPTVVTIMAGAHMLVVPSRVEAFGIVILEGWRAGVPVIATTEGGPPEFVSDGEEALLVDPTDQEALIRTLERLARDRDLRARVGAAGAQRVVDFTWADVGRAYEELYDQVIPVPVHS